MLTDKSVLLVGNFLSASRLGGRDVCEDLALRLTSSGWSVLTTSSKIDRLPRLVDMLATTWRQRGHYAAAQVDVFSGPAFLWAEAVCLTLRRAGRPYALTLHGGSLPDFSRRWPGRVRRLLGSATFVTTPSRFLFDQMNQYRSDLRLLPNPLDLTAYTFTLRSLPTPRLVWLRAFHNIYNPALALSVLARLAPAFPEAHLTMVGPDKDDGTLDKVMRLADQLNIRHLITLPGGVPKEDVPTWINKGDIFINTANVDNTPISVLEAMACGLCVVSTNVGGVPYLVEHEHDGLLVPPDDPEAMHAAVCRLLTEPDLASRLSNNARLKAEQHDWSRILPQWEALLASAIQTRVVPEASSS